MSGSGGGGGCTVDYLITHSVGESPWLCMTRFYAWAYCHMVCDQCDQLTVGYWQFVGLLYVCAMHSNL